MAIRFRLCAIGLLLASCVAGQQSNYSNGGGSISLGTDLSISGSTVSSPAGIYSFDCPATALPPGTYQAEWVCNGGTVSIASNDGLTALNGTVTSGTLIETASGGGRGNPTKYYYSFSGTFTGTLTANGQTVAVTGITSQATGGSTSPLGSGTLSGGTTWVNGQYEPIYITDTYNYRVVRMDDMAGDNFTAVGKYGSGVRQFELPWGLYVDSAGRIYVTDSATCRVIRMDNISGANWKSLGACGSGSNQFNNPMGVFVDAKGYIYVADSGNNRIVRFGNMSGNGWTTYGVQGSGTGQFNQPQSVAVSPSGQIFVADGGNGRIVRMDNITGANWTTNGGAGQFSSQMALSLDSTGRIYLADTYGDRIVRMDDMAGTNWTVLGGTSGSAFQFINPYGVSVDQYGTIYIADSRDYRLVMTDDMLGDAWTTYTGGSIPAFDSPTTIFPVPPASPIGVATYTASGLKFSDTVVGTDSAAQSVTMTNIGSAPLEINSVAASGDFQQTNTCGGSLAVGQNCSISVAFAPAAGGTRTGSVTLSFASGTTKTIKLTGTGTLVAVSPATLSFGNVNVDTYTSMTVTVSNPGTASAGISSITLKAPAVYRMKNPCPTSLAVNASCTVTLFFIPQSAAIYNGSLTITDASSTAQVVSITGTGVSN